MESLTIPVNVFSVRTICWVCFRTEPVSVADNARNARTFTTNFLFFIGVFLSFVKLGCIARLTLIDLLLPHVNALRFIRLVPAATCHAAGRAPSSKQRKPEPESVRESLM